ncbi:hypothetical protein [Streptomyces sp. NPDC046862]|uniref:hypothetical protein n=1 Tax=Streptomyces sp. NPDC046862 TaxID=3154603 RepID=UPI003452313E
MPFNHETFARFAKQPRAPMPIIGPDDREYDNYDPAWKTQDTPFRRWLVEPLAAGTQVLVVGGWTRLRGPHIWHRRKAADSARSMLEPPTSP